MREKIWKKRALEDVFGASCLCIQARPNVSGVVPLETHSTSFCCAPPDTGVSGLMLVALERLPSIEGALEIQIDVTFLRGPCRGAVSRRLTERLYQTCSDLSVSASPSHLPWKGRLLAVLIRKIIRHYGNIAIYAKHSTLRYNNPPISKEALAHPSHFWYPETS